MKLTKEMKIDLKELKDIIERKFNVEVKSLKSSKVGLRAFIE